MTVLDMAQLSLREVNQTLQEAAGSGRPAAFEIAAPRGAHAVAAGLDGRGDDPGRPSGAGDHRARPGLGAAGDRGAGGRQPLRHRPRPARADRRRPGDRQDLAGRRRDLQPEGPRRDLRLCRRRPAHQRGGTRDRRGARAWRSGAMHFRRRRRGSGARAAMDRALRGHGDGRAFPRQRPRRADRDRRPDAPCRHPSRAGAPDPRAAGARGLSGRCLLPACAPAGTRGEALAGARRRIADGAADRRDRCRQPLGLYPDQPDFDHRRADRAVDAFVFRGTAAGRRCRPVGQPGRRQGADTGAAGGLGAGAARLRAVPGAGDVHPLRRSDLAPGARADRPRRADPGAADPAWNPRSRAIWAISRLPPRRWPGRSRRRAALSPARWRNRPPR